MEEKMIMMDVLEEIKCMTVNTATAMNEAGSAGIYNLYSNIFKTLSLEVKEVFGLCYKNGWYQLEATPETKIQQEIKKLCNELNKDN